MKKIDNSVTNSSYIYLLFALEDYDKISPYLEEITKRFIVCYSNNKKHFSIDMNQLSHASLLIYFVSNNSIANQDCYNAAICARDNNIPFINIILKNTSLTKRFDDDFSRYQMAYEEKFSSAKQLIDSIANKTPSINETLIAKNKKIDKYIFKRKYVDNPEEYLDAVREGYCDIKIPNNQEEALKRLLHKHIDESGDILYEYYKVIDYLEYANENPKMISDLEALMEKGHVKGIYGLAKYKDDEVLFQKAIDMGYAIAYYDLAFYKKDIKTIIHLLEKAAEYEYVEAEMTLGELYYAGESIYFDDAKIKIDYRKAFYWNKRAASQGVDLAEYYVGVMYLEGKGVKKSYKDAYEWFLKATSHEEQTIRQHSQHYLGVMYYYGYGVKQDYNEALQWFNKAAKRNIRETGYYLGLMYFNGQGVEQSYQLAFKYFAWGGDSNSEYYLGYMYYNGVYVEQSYKEAAKYWERSAEEGNIDSQYSLAILYLNGEGVEKSIEKAIYWLEKASKQGHKKAIELFKKTKSKKH